MRGWRGGTVLVLAVLLSGCAAPEATAPASVAPVPDDAEDDPFGYPRHEDTPEAGPKDPPQSDPTPAGPSGSATARPADGAQDDDEDAEDDTDGPTYPDSWTRPPPRPLPDPLTGLKHLSGTTVGGGAGIAVFGHHAFVGTYSPPHLWVVDIMDPSDPKVVAEMPDVPVRDADVIAYPDGRLVLVTASGGSAFYVTDVTDPADPYLLGTVKTKHTNHNLAVVPGAPLVYNAASGGGTDIWDLTDPARPVLVQDWSGGPCHDIAFLVDDDEEIYRGYCAGYHDVEIWDLEDPRQPRIVHAFPFPVGGIQQGPGGISPASFAHLAVPNDDGTVLVVGDETGGGAAPGCDLYADTPAAPVSGPAGNVWFYDITNERDPVLRGGVSPGIEDGGTQCTAHFGRVVPGTDHAVVGFYQAGVVLIDFEDLDAPRIKDRWTGGSIWDAQPYQGYVLTGDIRRGLDILIYT